MARKTLCCSWARSVSFLLFFLFFFSFAFGALLPTMGGRERNEDVSEKAFSRGKKTLRVLHKAHLENITYGKSSLKEKIVHINFDEIIIIY